MDDFKIGFVPKEKLALSIPFEMEWTGLLHQISPFLDELIASKVQFHFLRLSKEKDELNLKIDRADLPILIDLFKENDVRISTGEWRSFKPSLDRFGGQKAFAVWDDYLNNSTIPLLNILRMSEDLVYEDLISHAVFLCSYISKKLFSIPEHRSEFLKMYFEHWKSYFPNEYSLENISQEYSEELAVLKSIIDYYEVNTDEKLVFVEYEKCSAQIEILNSQLKGLEEKGGLYTRSDHYKYKYKIQAVKEQTRIEILADGLHYTFNRIGLNNEDEALCVALVMEIISHESGRN